MLSPAIEALPNIPNDDLCLVGKQIAPPNLAMWLLFAEQYASFFMPKVFIVLSSLCEAKKRHLSWLFPEARLSLKSLFLTNIL
jgi:hypothetical protein